MLVQFSTDANIAGTEALAEQVEASIRGGLGHLCDQLTRVEVHLSDTNSGAKGGADDKRCVLEARPVTLKPIAVTHQAATPEEAVDGATGKLKRALESLFGRLSAR